MPPTPAMLSLEAEVQQLRRQNRELQSQLDRIASAPGPGATSRPGAEDAASPPGDGIELSELPERNRTVDLPRRRRRSASVPSGAADACDVAEGDTAPPRAGGASEEAGFDNECHGEPRPASTKRTAPASYAPLGDEGTGARSGLPPLAPATEDDDEREDLMHDDIINDDSSHNKHQDKGLAPSSLPFPRASLPLSVAPSPPPFGAQLRERAGWLIGLLFLQSCSSFIIAANEPFLEAHMVLVQFLTMLVGAGGNAGNQAAVGVIRALAVGTVNDRRTATDFLRREARMGLSLAGLIGMTGFVRAYLFRTPWGETLAITASVTLIVFISVALGSTLPLLMRRVGIDPAHSSTSIQVIMDILGVLITVSVSSLVLSLPVFQSNAAEGE